ncbi:hypothetical protein G4X40_19230 [Rhodococcus sp. D2-41]|uniref:Uncharacterized protein n=1 Tax=Speluncibacter jeojiensis TaxID=2710754 RepID=A0A9X4RE28_9ACTN|nr:hypothetical protein [Rhodococcus sp. D2-41]MDG3012277.1 hypothetical protein [Rhodococcus sp. D2-41]MDG3014752.1 hypothetical protein [Corynebacteriales bacterium D3-21]
MAKQLVAECDRLLDKLAVYENDTSRLAMLSGFGDIPSAQALQAGFARKAVDGEASIRGRIAQFRAELTRIRENFAAGGGAFAQAEADNAARLRNSAADL